LFAGLNEIRNQVAEIQQNEGPQGMEKHITQIADRYI